MARKERTLPERIEIMIMTDRYEKEDMTEKLNVFLLYEQLTKEEYEKLIKLMEDKEKPKEQEISKEIS